MTTKMGYLDSDFRKKLTPPWWGEEHGRLHDCVCREIPPNGCLAIHFQLTNTSHIGILLRRELQFALHEICHKDAETPLAGV